MSDATPTAAAAQDTPPHCLVAFIGAGPTGREHTRAFRDVPGVTLAGIHNRTQARAAALAAEQAIPVVADTIGELYERTRADLVVIAVRESAIGEVAAAAFAYPWTVLLEKPPGIDLADCRSIRSEAHQRHRRVLVALNRRFYSSTLAARKDLASAAGQRTILVQDQQDVAAARARGLPAAVCERLMFTNSIHLIDYLLQFGRGAIAGVKVAARWNPAAPGPVAAAVEFSSGDRGIYCGIWNAPGPWAVAITTGDRRWELRPLETAAYQTREDRKVHPVESDRWDRDFKPGFRRQAEAAVAAALGRDSACPNLDDAQATMELIARIYG